MGNSKLIKRLFTQEEIIAIENENRRLKEERKDRKRSLLNEGKMVQDIDEWNNLVEERNDLLEENKKLKEENDKLQTGPYEYSYIKKLKKQNEKWGEENRKLKGKQKVLDKENCELIDENVKLKKWIYQNVHGGPRIDYQEFCKKNGI